MPGKIAMVGFGELGKQFLEFLRISNPDISKVIFFDDILFKEKSENSFPYANYKSADFSDFDFYVPLGYKHLEEKSSVIKSLIALKRNLPSFTHPTTFFNSSSQPGIGNFIYPMCNIDKEVVLGNGILLNNSVTISHNNTIGSGCYLSPGVVTSGNVEIGENTFIGSGAVISNSIKIGKNVKIGIGSVINRDIPDNCSVIGNPFRILQNPLNII